MKWGRKKSSSMNLITRVFPVSWFSKFKQKRGNQEQSSAKNSVLDHAPSPIPSSYREGRFYSMDGDDAFWRISFSDDRVQPRRSTGGINPLRHDSDIQNPNILSEFKRFGLAEADEAGECRNFSEMVSDIKKMRERRRKQKQRANGGEREVSPSPVHESNSAVSSSTKETKNPIKEIKTRSNNNFIGMKACSPRTECKIRALEEMKRARARRSGKKRKEEAKSVYESFAVVKRSVDPEGDFKESMVEMIREKGIGDPHDLEQLLACYLSLNSDRYHRLIIAVFQQVWMDLH